LVDSVCISFPLFVAAFISPALNFVGEYYIFTDIQSFNYLIK